MGDALINVGRTIRTGEMSMMRSLVRAIDVASQKFDKVSDLQSKVELAKLKRIKETTNKRTSISYR